MTTVEDLLICCKITENQLANHLQSIGDSVLYRYYRITSQYLEYIESARIFIYNNKQTKINARRSDVISVTIVFPTRHRNMN